jgi:hypothetical protein
MEKNNMVGIITAPKYGGGFSTWGCGNELDQVLARAIEDRDLKTMKTILSTCSQEEFLEPGELIVTWVKEGTKYRIDEYDGVEILILPENLDKIAIGE